MGKWLRRFLGLAPRAMTHQDKGPGTTPEARQGEHNRGTMPDGTPWEARIEADGSRASFTIGEDADH